MTERDSRSLNNENNQTDSQPHPPVSQEGTRNFSKKNTIFSILLIIILGFVVYGNSLNGQFIWDDAFLIEENQYIKSFSHLPKLLTQNLGASSEHEYSFYRPLQGATYAIDYALWGLNVKGYHLTNILLHILSALSIYWLIYVIFKDHALSLLTGIFFVVHPIHTETVAYISGRSDSLALLFMILCFIFYIKSLLSKRLGVYAIMLICYALALLSKESSLIMPALLLLYHYSFKKELKGKEFLSIIGLASIYVFLRVTVLSGLQKSVTYSTTLLERLPGFFAALTDYIKLLFFPFDLHMEYRNRLFQWGDPKVILGAALLSVLLFYAYRKKENKMLVLFSIGWFLVAILPVANLYPINAYMAEHWLYLPSIGFFLIIAKITSSLYRMPAYKSLTAIFVLSILTFHSYLTIQQNRTWREPISFYERTLKFSPDSPRVHYNLGQAYFKIDRKKESIASYKNAIAYRPNFVRAYNNLGNVYYAVNENENAIASYKKAIEIKPDHASAHYNLGNMYTIINERENAVASYKRAIEINGDYLDAKNKITALKDIMKKKQDAVARYKKTMKINTGESENLSHQEGVFLGE